MDNLFLKATLKGQRFNEHTLPLQLARDFIAYEDLIVELAKHIYKKDYPDRERVLRGFTEGFSLQLKSIGEGSTVIVLERQSDPGILLNTDYFTMARDLVNELIQGVETSQNILKDFPGHLLSYFNKFGQSIRDDEELELSAPSKTAVIYTRKIRKILVSRSSKPEISDWITLRGSITEADAKKNSFTILPIAGRLLPTEIPEGFWEVISQALNNYRIEQGKVAVQCLVVYDSMGMIKRIDEIKHIEFLDPLDIQARTEEISLLTDGWMDGEGIAPTKELLKWISDFFTASYPKDMPLPCIYPALDGALSLEWSNAKVEISLLIPPDHKKCLLSILVIPEEKYEEKSIELSAEDGRNSLFNAIRTLVVEAGR
jgi:hypothetical protein